MAYNSKFFSLCGELQTALYENLVPFGWTIYDNNAIINYYGSDVSGVDMCCTDGKTIINIKVKALSSDIKEMTHFIYSASIIEDVCKLPTKNIFLSTHSVSQNIDCAAKRKNIDIITKADGGHQHIITQQIIQKIFEFSRGLNVNDMGVISHNAGTPMTGIITGVSALPQISRSGGYNPNGYQQYEYHSNGY